MVFAGDQPDLFFGFLSFERQSKLLNIFPSGVFSNNLFRQRLIYQFRGHAIGIQAVCWSAQVLYSAITISFNLCVLFSCVSIRTCYFLASSKSICIRFILLHAVVIMRSTDFRCQFHFLNFSIRDSCSMGCCSDCSCVWMVQF